jgi:septal ring factor EnvC (AmiA/AmiB activator)
MGDYTSRGQVDFTKLVLVTSLSLLLSVNTLAAGDLVQSRNEVMKLGARLNNLERELGQNNNKYLSSIEKIRLIETDILSYQERLDVVKAEVQKRHDELNQILRAKALALVEDEVVQVEKFDSILEMNKEKSAAAMKEAETLDKIVVSFQERLTLLKQDEEDLLKLTLDLESKKKQMTDIYLEKVKFNQELENKMQKQKVSTRLSAIKRAETLGLNIKPSLKFSSPLASYSSAIASEKGVTFKFEKLQPIRAPREGRVIYNGELANYGKVLMIDHGDDIRTVMLGKFQSTLEKNAAVNAGDILGHTEERTDSLYFEVRKKNIAQKTIHWMDTSVAGKI